MATSLAFAVIGDYGTDSAGEAAVASLVQNWNPEIVITTGDNNYPNGEATTIDVNVGKFYHGFIAPYRGAFGAGAASNRFFPALGNHDWNSFGAQPYLEYFSLPHNGRYYDFVAGSVHFFSIDSDPREPDGITAASPQARWLQAQLAASTARWKVVYMHHPPYASHKGGVHALRWPYAAWGADVVIAGHNHLYERLERQGMTYLINGLGGAPLLALDEPRHGSKMLYNASFGAMRGTASDDTLVLEMVAQDGSTIDTWAAP